MLTLFPFHSFSFPVFFFPLVITVGSNQPFSPLAMLVFIFSFVVGGLGTPKVMRVYMKSHTGLCVGIMFSFLLDNALFNF